MTTLYLNRRDLELRPDGRRALALYQGQQRLRSLPLGYLERIVAHADVRLSTAVLNRLGEAGVSLLSLGSRSVRQGALMQGAWGPDPAPRLAQYRLSEEPGERDRWARLLVAAKLRGQQQAVRQWRAGARDGGRTAERSLATLGHIGERLAREAPDGETLLGLEGDAARATFAALAADLPEELGFSGRRKRPPPDPVNAVLSLTYTLLHAEAVAACYAAGLDPYIGFYHRPLRGRESLAADLIEPLRPRAERWVRELFREQILRARDTYQSNGGCWLAKEAKGRFYTAYEGRAPAWRRLLRRYVRNVRRGLADWEPALPAEEDDDGR
jgi:CRISPR-associated protein Cas1